MRILKNGIRFNTWHFWTIESQNHHLLEGWSEASFFVVIDTSHSSLEHSKQQRNKQTKWISFSASSTNERLENDMNSHLDENCLYYSETVWCCLSFNKLQTKRTNEAVDMILITKVDFVRLILLLLLCGSPAARQCEQSAADLLSNYFQLDGISRSLFVSLIIPTSLSVCVCVWENIKTFDAVGWKLERKTLKWRRAPSYFAICNWRKDLASRDQSSLTIEILSTASRPHVAPIQTDGSTEYFLLPSSSSSSSRSTLFIFFF